MMELAALIELAQDAKPSHVFRSILQPKVDILGDYTTDQPIRKDVVPINRSQLQVVTGLKYALEKVQGPPGTGKSTTIFHIISSRIPAHARILVTCSRNVAVESIAQKLEACYEDGLLVFGNENRIGETAKRHLLKSRCERHASVGNLMVLQLQYTPLILK